MDWGSTVASSIISFVIGGLVTYWVNLVKQRKPFLSVMGINRQQKIVIVFPLRPIPQENNPGELRYHVTKEDMLAVNYIERALTLAGVSEQNIKLQSVEEFRRTTESKNHNVVLICSSRSNPLTKAALEGISSRPNNPAINFIPLNDDQWQLSFSGNLYPSDSYNQQEAGPESCPLDDNALIVRAQSPWADDKVAIIVAGVRGFGTWGAARYLREGIKHLKSKTKGKGFACVLKIKYENYSVRCLEIDRISENLS